MSLLVTLPSPGMASSSAAHAACASCLSPSTAHKLGSGAIFALPSPPYSQASASPSSSIGGPSSRRSSTSGSSSLDASGPCAPPLTAEPSEPTRPFDLDPDNRAQMFDFMRLDASETDCAMAAEVIYLLIPGTNVGSIASECKLLERYLLYWTSLTPHGLCVLITTVILLERLRSLHPGLSATGQVKDTVLRVVFSAYMAAMKLCTEVSYLNSAFVGRTPWSVREINSMERELLLHLDYDCFVPAEQVTARASAFCRARATARARRFRDDGAADFSALLAGGGLGTNLFRQPTYSAAYA